MTEKYNNKKQDKNYNKTKQILKVTILGAGIIIGSLALGSELENIVGKKDELGIKKVNIDYDLIQSQDYDLKNTSLKNNSCGPDCMACAVIINKEDNIKYKDNITKCANNCQPDCTVCKVMYNTQEEKEIKDIKLADCAVICSPSDCSPTS